MPILLRAIMVLISPLALEKTFPTFMSQLLPSLASVTTELWLNKAIYFSSEKCLCEDINILKITFSQNKHHIPLEEEIGEFC